MKNTFFASYRVHNGKPENNRINGPRRTRVHVFVVNEKIQVKKSGEKKMIIIIINIYVYK
jgi:hypothetical protein